MPELRHRLPRLPRLTTGRRTLRMIAHLGVVGVLVISALMAVSAGSGSRQLANQSLGFVSMARGAAEQQAPLRSVHFDLVADPRHRDQLLERRVLPTPAPTPRANPVAPPPATPEPARHVAHIAARPASNGSLLWPVPGAVITTYFSAGHTALDLAAPTGTHVLAADAGVVTFAGWRNNGGGWVVQVDHGNGIQTLYNHLGKILVSVGQQVGRGQTLGLVGCTGNCTGPHVHFEVRVGGIDVNPLRYL